MRTTVDLDGPLLERAKRRALRRGTTLSVIVREAVAAYLNQTAAADEEPFELITCGDPGGYAPSSEEMAAALEADDAALSRPTARRRRAHS
jgi:hypothetical protein